MMIWFYNINYINNRRLNNVPINIVFLTVLVPTGLNDTDLLQASLSTSSDKRIKRITEQCVRIKLNTKW